MKEAVVEKIQYLAGKQRLFPAQTTLKYISGAESREFCELVKKKMNDNPDYLNHMFRVTTAVILEKFNELLKSQPGFHKAIQSKDINGVDVAYLVKQWLGKTVPEKNYG